MPRRSPVRPITSADPGHFTVDFENTSADVNDAAVPVSDRKYFAVHRMDVEYPTTAIDRMAAGALIRQDPDGFVHGREPSPPHRLGQRPQRFVPSPRGGGRDGAAGRVGRRNGEDRGHLG